MDRALYEQRSAPRSVAQTGESVALAAPSARCPVDADHFLGAARAVRARYPWLPTTEVRARSRAALVAMRTLLAGSSARRLASSIAQKARWLGG